MHCLVKSVRLAAAAAATTNFVCFNFAKSFFVLCAQLFRIETKIRIRNIRRTLLV